jgi:ribonuclease T
LLQNYISIDVEASGPTADYNMLSLGAVEVANLNNTFILPLLRPRNDMYIDEAVQVGFPDMTWEEIKQQGEPAHLATYRFAKWLDQFDKPVMVGFNAPFDWQFVNSYLWRYTTRKPLGINALDIKALYMGYSGVEWRKTTKRSMPKSLLSNRQHTHNALDDAIEQAEVFLKVMEAIASKHP